MYLLLMADLATDDLGSVWKNVNMFTDTDEYKQLSNRFFFCFFFFFLVYSINSCTKVNRILIQSNIAALLLITLLLLSN